MTTSVGWDAYLDDLEDEVRAIGADAVAGGPVRAAGPFLPPSHLGVLPERLAPRVREVLAGIAEASRLVRAELERTGDQLTLLARHDVRGPKPASTVDLEA